MKDEDVDNRITGKLKEYLELKQQYDEKRKEVMSRINSEVSSKRKRRREKRKQGLPSCIANQILGNKEADAEGAEVPLRPVQKLERMPFESDAAYINRVEIV